MVHGEGLVLGRSSRERTTQGGTVGVSLKTKLFRGSVMMGNVSWHAEGMCFDMKSTIYCSY